MRDYNYYKEYLHSIGELLFVTPLTPRRRPFARYFDFDLLSHPRSIRSDNPETWNMAFMRYTVYSSY
jgi:hypothetical protein